MDFEVPLVDYLKVIMENTQMSIFFIYILPYTHNIIKDQKCMCPPYSDILWGQMSDDKLVAEGSTYNITGTHLKGVKQILMGMEN